MSQSRLDRLGFDTQFASDEQIAVVDSLSDAEIELLVKIKHKLDDAAGDVEGHSLDAGGVVW
ncbi:aroma-sacti cluster domain-containing protein [Catellatospora tritici]|uniref:aroma-sacti cluster domain-containing protein n=1 Tax=Catellatospora tritici TaxID=2851566 RepID=UPI001C2D17AC|nr:aroma-sacti cluster domain-containing protein [Catellatospora tritici]MBV1850640.1 hypothetical protein [Catellatospora tritici]